MFFSCLAEHEVEDTGGCQALLVVLRSSHLESDFFFHSFIVTLLQGSCDFEHSTESGRLPSDVNSSLSVIMPSIAWLVILMRGSHWTCTRDFISYLDTGVLRRCASKEVFCSCGVHRADLEALKEEGEGGEVGGWRWLEPVNSWGLRVAMTWSPGLILRKLPFLQI